MEALKRIQSALQLDSPLTYVLATRAWQAISGPVTIALLIEFLAKPEQGVYYGILSVVGIQAYFELGLLSVLVGHASHEYAAVKQQSVSTDENISEQQDAAARMHELIRASTIWFSTGAVLYIVIATVLGWRTLIDSEVTWIGPLIFVVIVSAVSIAMSPALSILEGAGHRELIYRWRLVQAVIGSLTVWGALCLGLKLWTLVASSAIQAVVAVYIRFGATTSFWQQFRNVATSRSDFSWTRDVLPAQWRVALISMSFHFATQFFVVIVIMFHGDEAGAPLGMTLTVTNAIQMLSAAWVQSKYPLISSYLASGDRERAGTTWRHTAVISSGILILASGGFAAAVASLPYLIPKYVDNFLTPNQILLLCTGHVAGHVASLQGFYILARKAKPLVVASLIGASATGAAVWAGGYFYSTTGVVTGYALTMMFVLVPVHTYAYVSFRRQAT